MSQFDYDWIVVGSGFGGSVSALRLAEKGYSVGVLECGKRFPTRTSRSRPGTCKRYFWAPRVGLRGIFRLTPFKDVSVVSGCGVGGGSLGYANTLYVPPSEFFEDSQWKGLEDWESVLAPHYAEAQRMLGVVVHDNDDPADQLLREFGEHLGVERHLPQDPRRRLPRRAREDRLRSLLRRRGPGPHRLHAVRPLHGRLPPRRQEHAGQELPLAGRAPRRRRHPGPRGDRDPPARRRRRQRGLRGHQRAPRHLPRPRPPDPDRARRHRRRRPARHQQACCSAAASAAPCRGSPTASASWSAPTAR